jgi:hypothetical protein
LYHDDQLAGHWDVDNTKELLKRKFYWPGLVSDKGIRSDVFYLPEYKPYGTTEYDAILVVDCYTKNGSVYPDNCLASGPEIYSLILRQCRAKIRLL